MEDKWYEGLDEDALLNEEDRAYKNAIEKIKEGVKNGIGFDKVCDSVKIDDVELKKIIIDDALKLLIAEMHFAQKIPTDKVAGLLQISVERVNAARETMLDEIKLR